MSRSRSVSFCQAALPSGAAPIHPSPTPSTARERVPLGPTPCSKTTRSSVSACARPAPLVVLHSSKVWNKGLLTQIQDLYLANLLGMHDFRLF